MTDARGRGLAAAVLLLAGLSGGDAGNGAGPEPEELRRGLVASFDDGAAKVVRLEPTVALAFNAGEAPHPRLKADGGTASWDGYINLLRTGTYRFSARLRGEVVVKVGDKEVLKEAVRGDAPAVVEGPEVKLESGVCSFQALYVRPAGLAALDVTWKGPGFRTEPLPFDVLGHTTAQVTPRLEADARLERGRFLAEEHACVRCHRPAASDHVAAGLTNRAGPDLSSVGARVHAGWIERWLEDPHRLRPGAAMPVMFAADDDGKAGRYAVAHYLASLGGPVPANAKPPKEAELTASAARGQKLFTTLGCITCHAEAKKDDKPSSAAEAFITAAPARYPLTDLGSKTTPEALAEYLKNPLAADPSGRMPHLLLQPNEATDLARFLCQSKAEGASPDLPAAPPDAAQRAAFKRLGPKAEELTAFDKLPADSRWKDLGKRLVVAKGCVNCHAVQPGGKPAGDSPLFTALDDLRKPEKRAAGCLADDAAKRGAAPDFALAADDRDALRAFLDEGLTGAGSPAPAYAARATVRRFNCLACHTRDGEGGLTADLVEELRKFENAENAEAVAPPTLTGVGHKLRTPWLRQVLTGAGRARPWMGLRMPQFGEANVGKLPEQLAAADGTTPDDDLHKVPLTAAKIEAGRKLVGKTAFGCVSCHDLAGVPNTGTRGPDLAGMNQRVRYDWYLRWLEQPQRIQPGTRMPSVFADGKSLLPSVLDGDAAGQAEAMWGYLSLGPGLPLPEGMEPLKSAKGMVLTPEGRPTVLRTFMPDSGSRAVAVGYPNGVSLAFDAQTCRLAYAWSGNFLDASPVWDGRGGNPAKVLGPRFWTAPAGCPVGATSSNEPPDFAARAKDPAYGASLPEGKLFDGTPLLHFDGYATDKDGVPTFRYHVRAGGDEKVEVSERLEALRAGAAAGVARHFTLTVPARQTAWLLAAEGPREPRLLDGQGAAVALDLKPGLAEAPAAGKALALPQDGDRVLVLTLAAAPDGAAWRVQKTATGWQALLRLPGPADGGKVQADLNVWAPYRDEPALIKDLLSSK
jgi:cytochrome c553